LKDQYKLLTDLRNLGRKCFLFQTIVLQQ